MSVTDRIDPSHPLADGIARLTACAQRVGQLEQQRVERLTRLALLSDPRERTALTHELLMSEQRLRAACLARDEAQSAVDGLLHEAVVARADRADRADAAA
jgi:hypothetical protein